MPRYRAISATLLDDLAKGNALAGAQLPTEMQIAERFGVSRVTARQAVVLLEQRGLVRREAGRGTFLLKSPEFDQDLPVETRQVLFMLIDMSEQSKWEVAELLIAEEILRQNGMSFSWASIRTEDIIAGNYPAVLMQGMCCGLLLDGHVRDCHLAIGKRFDVPTLLVGNHQASRSSPQVRYALEEMASEATVFLHEKSGGAPVALMVEPLSLYSTREISAGYSSGLRTVGQAMDYLLTGPDSRLGSEVSRLQAALGQQFAIVTTGRILPGILNEYERLGISAAQCPIVVFDSTSVLRQCRPPEGVYIACIEPGEVSSRAAELVVQLVRNPSLQVYESIRNAIQPAWRVGVTDSVLV